MKIFDAQIRSDTRTDDDLRNLAYFDTARVVTTAHAPRTFDDARDLLEYFRHLLDNEVPRLERCGLQAGVALGVSWPAQPRRAHPEVFTELASLLTDERVAAVGEVGAWEDAPDHWALFDRHVELATATGLPLVVTPPTRLRINMTYKMMARVERAGFPLNRCFINQLDGRLLRTVVEEGFVGGLAVGARQLPPRVAAETLLGVLDALPGSLDGIVLSSSLRRGAADILGIPKTIVALTEAGLPESDITRLVWRNAEALFVRTPR